MGFEARNLGRARMIREAEPSGPTSTWWLGKTGEYTTDVLRREAMLVVCPERERDARESSIMQGNRYSREAWS